MLNQMVSWPSVLVGYDIQVFNTSGVSGTLVPAAVAAQPDNKTQGAISSASHRSTALPISPSFFGEVYTCLTLIFVFFLFH